MPIQDYSIIPLFPTVVFETKLEDNFDEDYAKMKDGYEFIDNFIYQNCYVSNCFTILDDFPKLKETLLKVFYIVKDEVLLYQNTDFAITTSWLTKVNPNATSHLHNHKNSFYSGVLYFDDIEDCGGLWFDRDSVGTSSFLVNEPLEYNIYNSSGWKIDPGKNVVVFFPSYLKHKVGYHKAPVDRYSLAFNIIPIGNFGMCDSTINLSVSVPRNNKDLKSIKGDFV